jgi:transposase-like protein
VREAGLPRKRGWCARHYARWHRYGSPEGVGPVRRFSTDIDVEWLRRRYLDELATVEALAAKAGCHPATIHRALRHHDIDRRGHAARHSPDRNVEVVTRDWLLERLGRVPLHGIAAEAGISKSKLQELRASLGLSARPNNTTQLRQWYEQGDTIAVIAQRLGIHRDTVRRQLVRAGVELRPSGRRPAR